MQAQLKFLLLSAVIIFSCTANDQKQGRNSDTKISSDDTIPKPDSIKTQTAKTSSSNRDTLIIDREAAVFYQPDSLQIEKRMNQAGEADFRAGAGDYIYYLNESAEYLKKQGIRVLDAKGKKYLKFILANKQVQLIKLDTLKELWGMYLFDPKKKPYAADITIIEDEYKTYSK